MPFIGVDRYRGAQEAITGDCIGHMYRFQVGSYYILFEK